MSYWVECYIVSKCINYTIIFDFPSEEGDIGPFVSNEVLWLKYKRCPSKSCYFLLFVSDVGMVYLTGILCNRCIIL